MNIPESEVNDNFTEFVKSQRVNGGEMRTKEKESGKKENELIGDLNIYEVWTICICI